MNGTLEERFWAKVDKTPTCWLWTAYIDRHGYGLFGGRDRTVLAHRLAYEMTLGPIPDGLTIDHLCRVRHCVRPDHLEPVTAKINVLRGTGFAATESQQTQCVYGHLFDDSNTLSVKGGRGCRACKNRRAAEHHAKNREKLTAYHKDRRAIVAAQQGAASERQYTVHSDCACLRCGWQWQTRRARRPTFCPNCRTLYWDQPK